MYFERDAYKDLLDWKNSDNRALLVIGGRGVGKSFLVNEFAHKEYATSITIDLSKQMQSMLDYILDNKTNPEQLCGYISAKYDVPLYSDNSIIVFDNIQNYLFTSEVVANIAKMGKYDVIGIGTQKGNNDIKNINVYPLNFEEFCIALGERDILISIYDCFKNMKCMEDANHEKAMYLYKQYIIVGGMPESVLAYIKNEQNIIFSNKQIEKILDDYNANIDGKNKGKIKDLYDRVPNYLSKSEKRIFVSDIEKKTSYTRSENVIGWLSGSNYVNECTQFTPPNEDAEADRRKYLKLYMSDTGMLLKHASNNDSSVYDSILQDDYSSNEGMLLENSVAQNLCGKGHRLKYYTHYNETSHHNDMSVDFIVYERENGGSEKICPIEIKTGTHYSTKSMERFIEKHKDQIRQAYIIHTKNVVVKKDIMCIPPYMTICI